ncbi:DUF928 domain-containing protein [Oscillatoriales cyanobacterium LEGE 11467]|uniref:DUF928 domain-containing protein n=1 Tax=Zarconia navalis LEGE 11467 TaxID=1828826 RepID=A0A928Z9B9_9CYAN|nr:DUF928 domain-containing protein [Zarconia navalis]MBE9040616.1 DUF928 domain-containing protein [Zarconia navalis LEGE 11467]
MTEDDRFLSRTGLSKTFYPIARVLCVGGTIAGLATMTVAQVSPSLRVTFEPPTDERLDDSAGGASRPVDRKCNADESTPVPMLTLMPEYMREGLTLTPHPTVFAYIPTTSARRALFSLKDDTGKIVYQQTFTLTQTDGIASITLPTDAPPLPLDRTYEWSLGMLCEPVQTDFPIAMGQIRRIAPTSPKLDDLPPLERAASYGQSGFWYDTLAVLDEVRRSQPENEATAMVWTDFLDSVGLEEISSKPPLNLE